MCIFCDIIEGKIPSYKIYEDEYTYAFLDISCDAVGHTLVIPKKHYENILDCDKDTYLCVMDTVKKISEHYTKNCGYSGVNLMNASGADAQQSVFHLHIHIVPRKNNDGMNTWPQLEKKELNLAEIQNILKL